MGMGMNIATEEGKMAIHTVRTQFRMPRRVTVTVTVMTRASTLIQQRLQMKEEASKIFFHKSELVASRVLLGTVFGVHSLQDQMRATQQWQTDHLEPQPGSQWPVSAICMGAIADEPPVHTREASVLLTTSISTQHPSETRSSMQPGKEKSLMNLTLTKKKPFWTSTGQVILRIDVHTVPSQTAHLRKAMDTQAMVPYANKAVATMITPPTIIGNRRSKLQVVRVAMGILMVT